MRIRICCLALLGIKRGHLSACATCLFQKHVADFDIFDRVTGHPTQNRWQLRSPRTDYVAEDYATHHARLGVARASHPRAETQKQGSATDVAHGDAGKRDVFDDCAVLALERKSLAPFKYAVGNGHVEKAAIRFRAQLDAASG